MFKYVCHQQNRNFTGKSMHTVTKSFIFKQKEFQENECCIFLNSIFIWFSLVVTKRLIKLLTRSQIYRWYWHWIVSRHTGWPPDRGHSAQRIAATRTSSQTTWSLGPLKDKQDHKIHVCYDDITICFISHQIHACSAKITFCAYPVMCSGVHVLFNLVIYLPVTSNRFLSLLESIGWEQQSQGISFLSIGIR